MYNTFVLHGGGCDSQCKPSLFPKWVAFVECKKLGLESKELQDNFDYFKVD